MSNTDNDTKSSAWILTMIRLKKIHYIIYISPYCSLQAVQNPSKMNTPYCMP